MLKATRQTFGTRALPAPRVAFFANGEVPPALRQLLMHLMPIAPSVAFDEVVANRFRACIVLDPSLLSSVPAGLPIAAWCDDREEAAELAALDVVKVVLSPDPEVVVAVPEKGVVVPAHPQVFSDVRPMLPASRERIRRARGLQPDAIAVVDEGSGELTWCGEPLEGRLVDTALACAAAVVVRGDALIRAMAWAAPIVTDSVSGRAVGASHERELIVADDDALAVAQALAGDLTRASSLAWAARRFFEERVDPDRAALATARGLGVLPYGADAVATRLAELGTPMAAPSVDHAYHLLEPFVA
jgi:hypothetical protein